MLTQKILKKYLHYDPETGLFTWKIQRTNKANIGSIAGYIDSVGYITIGVLGKQYRAHRLAVFYMKGHWPIEVDHEDHVRYNNKWSNLREVDRSENNKNLSFRSDNTSGTTGVYFSKAAKKWYALITVNKKIVWLGYCKHKSKAIKRRKQAEIENGYHENYGR